MHSLFSLTFSALVTLTFAAPAIHHVVHEQRSHLPAGWEVHSDVEKHMVVPVRIGLTQSNLDNAYEVLMGVSDPDSPTYGNHWSPQEVANFFAPSPESVDAVKTWLASSGITPEEMSQKATPGWVEFSTTITKLEALLKTKYNHYVHDSGKLHVGCKEYSVPANIQNHIDFITPTLHFDTKVPQAATLAQLEKRKQKVRPESTVVLTNGPSIGKSIGNVNAAAGTTKATDNTQNCNQYITPACLRALYGIPRGTKNLSSFGIVEYAPQTFLQSDLNGFQTSAYTNTGIVPSGTAPKIVGVDGGYMTPSSEITANIVAESDLDLEYAMDLVYPQTVTLFQVGDHGVNSAQISFNNFLDSIDKSYCTYMGGDTSFDEAFPDPGGYSGPPMCGTITPTSVISTSYVYNEADLTPAYEQRQCNEYMKLGLLGISIIYSSGDGGVSGTGSRCINPSGGYTDGSSGKFNPSFPASCPYVTSVGATQVLSSGSVTTPETACSTVIYSGGGFSNVFPMPSYQSSAVKSYFTKYNPGYTAATYNNSQTVRGYPDVSANGAAYVVAVNGNLLLAYGTSASAPTFGAIITLINNERVAVGKKALGFLNPAMYNNPAMFNDITSGGNQGCGTSGFTAKPGWDPVTGLGTPIYSKMLSVLKALS